MTIAKRLRRPQGDGYNFARASRSAARPSAQFGNPVRSEHAQHPQSAIEAQDGPATVRVHEQAQSNRWAELTFRSGRQRLIREFRPDELKRPAAPKPWLRESQWEKHRWLPVRQ